MEENKRRILAFPRHRFNPFAGYPRIKVGEIENNLTRAMFVGLKEVAESGRLGDFLSGLPSTAATSTKGALTRLDAIKHAVEKARVIQFTLLNAPPALGLDRSKVLVLGVAGGTPSHQSGEWTVGKRDGETSIPDGAIVAEDAMIVFESKHPKESLDALQVARHLARLGMLNNLEESELGRGLQAWSGASWRAALADRVLEVRWTDVISLLHGLLQKSRSPSLEATVEYLSDCVGSIGSKDDLHKKVVRTREAVAGLLGATEVARGSGVTMLDAFHMV